MAKPTLEDCVNVLLRQTTKRSAGNHRRDRRAAAKVLRKRWDGWNSTVINLTHTQMVNLMYPRRPNYPG